MTRFLCTVAVVLLISIAGVGLAAKKKQITTVSAIYELDTWIGTTFELFLKEYKLKMPKKIDLTFANSPSEFQALARVTVNLGAIAIGGTIVVSSERIDNSTRIPLLRELMRLTLIENKRAKDADRIIAEFFKKYKIK